MLKNECFMEVFMWLKQLYAWKLKRIPCAIVTIIAAEGSTPRGIGAKMVVNANGETAGTIGGGNIEFLAVSEALNAITGNRFLTLQYSLDGDDWKPDGTGSKGICGGRLTLFIEPIMPRKEIIMFGGGHVAEKLAALCEAMTLPYRVYDDRPDYAGKERFPRAQETVSASFADIAGHIQLSTVSYCVIMTYGHVHDETCLEQLLANKDIPYIGMMGSRQKVSALFEKMAGKNLLIDKRVFSPIGLKIGTELPEEIALSILAEIVCLMNGGTPEHFSKLLE